MAFIPVPDVVMVELIYTTPGGKAENTLYFDTPLEHTPEHLTDIAEGVLSWWTDEIREFVSSDCSLSAIKVTSLNSATSSQVEYTTGMPFAGTNGHVVLPSNVTAAVTFLTAQRGRSFRGRNYVIGLAEDDVAGDTIDTDVVDNWSGGYELLILEAPDFDCIWVVVSRYSGVDEEGDPIPRETGIATQITGVRMDNTVDSQRRRLRHRGQ